MEGPGLVLAEPLRASKEACSRSTNDPSPRSTSARPIGREYPIYHQIFDVFVIFVQSPSKGWLGHPFLDANRLGVGKFIFSPNAFFAD